MKKLICITGMDGIGKSTLIKNLSIQLDSCYLANIWDLLESKVQGLPFKSKKEIDDFLCALSPDSRFLFLMHALKYSIDTAFASDKKIILMDSYHYKYIATELALAANPVLVKDVEKSFPLPDQVIELILPLEEIAERKNKFSRYECGLATSANKESFKMFQEQVIKEWKSFKIKNHYQLDAFKSEADLTSEAIRLIDDLIKK